MQRYLADLNCATVLEEPTYFDRDYLSEFAAFYGVSSRGYPNRCRRLHFFSARVTRPNLRAAAAGSKIAIAKLQDSYLGFAVVRPMETSPLGRTVIRAYPDAAPETPRVVESFRTYRVHLAGISLSVEGLGWQQQDAGVGACATIALWTMFHSSALDDHHAIPTTADITRYAHRTASLGGRVFPSSGLTISQLCEAIKEAGLAPIVVPGDRSSVVLGERRTGFSRERFASASASFLRSGYPLIILGELQGKSTPATHHAICAVGFRETAAQEPQPGRTALQDEHVEYLYVHDDNIGPNVRMHITEVAVGRGRRASRVVHLTQSAPGSRLERPFPDDVFQNWPAFVPSQIVAAVPEDLRTSPDVLLERAIIEANELWSAHNHFVDKGTIRHDHIGLTVSTRFIKIDGYVEDELGRVLRGSRHLSRTRLALHEDVAPMSLHLGIVRIGWGDVPLLDIVHDTTDSNRSLRAFCNIQFQPLWGEVVEAIEASGRLDLGMPIAAY